MAAVTSSMLVPVGRSASASDVVIAMAEPQGTNVTAVFRFVKNIDGNGLELAISARGLDVGAEYPFHIHVSPVPSDGNCTATGGHLNPYNIPSSTKCSKDDALKTCELGDLAGIYGNLVGDDQGQCLMNINATELTFGGENTILDHSIVIHNSNKDRVACSSIIGYILSNNPASAAGLNESSEMGDMDMEDMNMKDMENMGESSSTNDALPRAASLSGALLALAGAALF
ncbi:hypothetical protein IWW50_002811 [Coemansia erecta]|nr:hypothetical protein IWW50_002811 [Coemansia erecta]